MAIKNMTTGEYVKVIGINLDFTNHPLYGIIYLRFANQEQRERYETGLSIYETYGHSLYDGYNAIEAALEVLPSNLSSTKQAMFNAAYSALKADIFTNWEDC